MQKTKTFFFSFVFLLFNCLSITASDVNKPETMESLSVPSAKFAISLYNILRSSKDETENIFVSPFSISTVMAMTLLGAKGNTESQIIDALHLKDVPEIHQAFGKLLEMTSSSSGEHFILHIANRIFTRQGLSFHSEYLQNLDLNYKAKAKDVDFRSNPGEARIEINKWVEHQTASKIKDLLPDGSVNSLTAAVLVNAIYFKGDWLSKFDSKNTEPGTFHLTKEKSISVHMMFKNQKLPYGKNRDTKFHLVHLPYKGDELSMVVLLPFEHNGLKAIEESLTPESLLEAVRKTRSVKVELTLPKFKVEDIFDLTDNLKSIGISDLFDQDIADLSGISDEQLFVSKVVHKTFLEVNEEGSEAAAATGAVMMMRSMPAPPVMFAADHPFLVAIFDKRTNALLFWGRIAHPTEVPATKEEL